MQISTIPVYCPNQQLSVSVMRDCKRLAVTVQLSQCPHMAPTPPQVPFCVGHTPPNGPPESATQTASRSVQPFLQGSRKWPTHTHIHTDRPRYSVCSNRPLSLDVMRTNKKWQLLKPESAPQADRRSVCVTYANISTDTSVARVSRDS